MRFAKPFGRRVLALIPILLNPARSKGIALIEHSVSSEWRVGWKERFIR